MESVLIRREIEFREKLEIILSKLSIESGFPIGRLREGFRENYSRVVKYSNNHRVKVHPKNFNIITLVMILRSCSSKDAIHLFCDDNISNVEKAEAYLVYKEHNFSDEEIYGSFQNLIIDEDDFNFLYKKKLYIPYESSIESDAFDVNIVFFSSEIGRNILRYRILPISIPKNEIVPISDCYSYFSDFPNPNEIDFWINLYSLEKYRNLFLDGEDKSDKILLEYEFSSYPLEDSKKYIC
jgi:hypothetical protein